jgi:hypothetical protein
VPLRKPDYLHRRPLLRTSDERPRCRAAEQRDELAPLHLLAHSITSSARAITVAGTSRPSALAVLRLITSSRHSAIPLLAQLVTAKSGKG